MYVVLVIRKGFKGNSEFYECEDKTTARVKVEDILQQEEERGFYRREGLIKVFRLGKEVRRVVF